LPPAHLEPSGVAPDEADAIPDGAEVLASASREVVQHGDVRAIAHKALDEVRADESGAASDEVSHGLR